MNTVTLSQAKGYLASDKAAPKKAGILSRLYDAIIAAGAAKAEREIALYAQRTGFDPRK